MLHKIFIITIVIITFLTGLSLGCSSTNHTTPLLNTGSIKIYIKDYAGNPLQGAKIVSEEQPAGQLKLSGLTDANGLVTFTSIPLGNYRFVISRFNFVPQELDYTVKSQNETVVVNMVQQEGVNTTTSTVPPKP